MGSQKARFRFMVQLKEVIRKTEEKPFHGDVIFPPGKETAELHVLLGHSKGTFCLDGTVDAQDTARDPIKNCVNDKS